MIRNIKKSEIDYCVGLAYDYYKEDPLAHLWSFNHSKCKAYLGNLIEFSESYPELAYCKMYGDGEGTIAVERNDTTMFTTDDPGAIIRVVHTDPDLSPRRRVKVALALLDDAVEWARSHNIPHFRFSSSLPSKDFMVKLLVKRGWTEFFDGAYIKLGA